ncbi:MAG: sigma-70 family RNA polymerase sigma factor [Eubacterium sp.]|nr:sigma-70 family RNA polymerase sigma factor [Eubacterium sp.]
MNKNENCVTAFNDMYDKYYKKVLSYFKKEFNIDEAEDLTQQTFLQLWSWAPNLQFTKNKKALIFHIAKNVRCDRYRQKAMMLDALSLADDFEISDCHSFTDEVDLKLSMQNVITQQDKQLLILTGQGYKSGEIGRMLGISSSAVRTRLQKLRGKIKDNVTDI